MVFGYGFNWWDAVGVEDAYIPGMSGNNRDGFHLSDSSFQAGDMLEVRTRRRSDKNANMTTYRP